MAMDPTGDLSRRRMLVLTGAAVGAALLGGTACGGPAHLVQVGAGPHQQEWVPVAEDAVRDVQDLWGDDALALPAAVQLPDTDSAFAAATGSAGTQEQIPAMTVGSGPGAVVVVHPDAWGLLSPEGRRAVLAHEFTHLAMQGDGPVPSWLGEGLAEYTAHRSSALSPAQIAGTALDPVRAGRLPTGWPDPGAASGGDRWQRYAMCWLLCVYLAQTWGEAELMQLYRRLSGGTLLADALREVLGTEQEQLLAGWRNWLPDATKMAS